MSGLAHSKASSPVQCCSRGGRAAERSCCGWLQANKERKHFQGGRRQIKGEDIHASACICLPVDSVPITRITIKLL